MRWHFSAWSRSLLLAATLLSTSCGYVKSGTWDDDPRNWKRAFRSGKPAPKPHRKGPPRGE